MFDLRPIHALGQNFLADDRVTEEICILANLAKSDLVIEIGPGIGALTQALIRHAGQVIAIEIDQHLLPALRSQIPVTANCRIMLADALKTDLAGLAAEWNGPLKVAANLPYYLTTPLIEKILCEFPGCSEIVLMVQKEVADRVMAIPGSKQYGPLPVLAASHGQVSRGINIPAASFIPQPRVDSCLIRINDIGKLQISDWPAYKSFLENCFAHRRKTLINNLKTTGLPPASLAKLKVYLESHGSSADIRAERLNIHDFFALHRFLHP
jgi:16S rRNA (adenine1518-N6/adenine1519-N6)-dimethyltransferase